MKRHNWIKEYIDAGHIDGEFWICADCDASGGPTLYDPPKWKPFYANGSGLQLSDDCIVSKEMIIKHLNEGGRKKTDL